MPQLLTVIPSIYLMCKQCKGIKAGAAYIQIILLYFTENLAKHNKIFTTGTLVFDRNTCFDIHCSYTIIRQLNIMG